MTDDKTRELIEAARPFAASVPRADWFCHGGDEARWTECGYCNALFRLRAAIEAAEPK